ncbi:hypothetical protein EVAR_72520_1 [Eumeta japonica]|uniref:Uncharacterized protein n=1 Tax=Eumeta variegata TaxID=151549 RepID=A0A4C1SF24_EUMVA|nr:hypothetical protein EVAR_72520_1 [Eumeta japonica]
MAVGRTHSKVHRQKVNFEATTWNAPRGKRKRGAPKKKVDKRYKTIYRQFCVLEMIHRRGAVNRSVLFRSFAESYQLRETYAVGPLVDVGHTSYDLSSGRRSD